MLVSRRNAFPLTITVFALAFFGLFLLYPLFNVFSASFLDPMGTRLTLENYGRVLSSTFYLGSLYNTLLVGVAATLITIVMGVPLAFCLARLPIPVSAALVTVILVLVLEQGFRRAWQLDPIRRWVVVAPALVPSFAWVVVSDDLSEHAQLLANPMLVGVVLAIALDRACTAWTNGRSDDR